MVVSVIAVYNISNDVGVVKCFAELFFLKSKTLLRDCRVGSPTDVLSSMILSISNQTARPDFVTSVELPTRHLSGHQDHDDLFELPPFGEAGSLFSYPVTARGRTTVVIRHTCMGFPALPQLSAATELFIINLVAHHDP